MRRGFTLLEVNLAIFVMAAGSLGMCALYGFGFREGRQSDEDVAAAAFADAYLGPLVQGLSATNMTWSAWQEIGEKPATGYNGDSELEKKGVFLLPKEGWVGYVNPPTDVDEHPYAYTVKDNPRSQADKVFKEVLGKVPSMYKGNDPGIPNDYQYALVLTRQGAVIRLAFRIGRRTNWLMTQPLFVSEVRFQGRGEE